MEKISSMAPPDRMPSQFHDSVLWVYVSADDRPTEGTVAVADSSSHTNVPRGSSSSGSSMAWRKSKSSWQIPWSWPLVRSVSIHTPRSLRTSDAAEGSCLRSLSVESTIADLVSTEWLSSRDEIAPLHLLMHFLSIAACVIMDSTIMRTHRGSIGVCEDTNLGRALITSRRM